MIAGQIYSGDNGRLMCSHCAGMTPLYTLRDLSGQRLHKIDACDNKVWDEYFKKNISCECGKTNWTPATA